MNKIISIKKLKSFGLIFGFFLILIIGFLFPIIVSSNFRIWTLFVGLPFIFAALAKPLLLKKPYKIFLKIGNILGLINTRIILGIVFIFILFPFAIVMRFFGYDPLKTKNCIIKSYKIYKEGENSNLQKIF
tara:strand:- start:157 stop:549 length:393 start_codon:yes stop_codon:yes gene_type:complete